MDIEELFADCKNQKFNDKDAIHAFKADPDMKQKIRDYYNKAKIFADDDLHTLFNWFIAVNFNYCLYEFHN